MRCAAATASSTERASPFEALAVLGDVDGVGRRPEYRHPGGLERLGELQRRLPAELHDDALGFLPARDLEDVFEGQRLKVEFVGDVEVGGYRLRVRVDHDRLIPEVAERETGAHAAVIELHTLADAVWTAAENHDPLLAERLRLVLFVVRRVQIGR